MPPDFSQTPPPPPPLNNEIATTGDGRDITRELQGKLFEPQDKVLKSKGGNYEVYEDILRDDQVQSCFQQRRLAVISREWEVQPGDAENPTAVEAADWVRTTLERVGWDSITDKMLYGVFYGYAIAEALYVPGERAVEVQAVKVRKQRRFKFGIDGLPKLITKDNKDGEDLPEGKFWHFATGADNDDEPYGLGLGYWLYWLVFFKRNGIKSWLKFLQNFAQPTKKGTYQPGATDEERKKLLQALAAIGEDSGIIVPEGVAIELIEAARSGTADYAVLQARMDAAIAKVILSQTMTTDSGSSYAQANVHAGVKEEVVKADADLVCGSFNSQVLPYWLAWNFPTLTPDLYPKVWRRIEDEPDLLPQAQRDEIIARLGFAPNQQYVQETYGDGFAPPEDDAQATLTGAQMEQLLRILDQSKSFSPEKRTAILKLAFPTLPEDQIALLIAEDPLTPSPSPTGEGNQPLSPDPAGGAVPLTPSPSPTGGEGNQTVNLSEALPQRNATVEAFVARLREKAQPEFERMVGQVREALNGSTDLVEFREKLDNLYPDLDGEMLTQIMAEAMFASKLAGIFEAQEGE